MKSLSAKIGCPQRLAAFSNTSCTWKDPASSESADRIWSKYSLSAPSDLIAEASSRLSRWRAADSNLKKYCLLLFSSALECPCFLLTDESAWRGEWDRWREVDPTRRATPQRYDTTSVPDNTCPRGLHDPTKALKLVVIVMLLQRPFVVPSSPELVTPRSLISSERGWEGDTVTTHTACQGKNKAQKLVGCWTHAGARTKDPVTTGYPIRRARRDPSGAPRLRRQAGCICGALHREQQPSLRHDVFPLHWANLGPLSVAWGKCIADAGWLCSGP